jgi:hypothetical protein
MVRNDFTSCLCLFLAFPSRVVKVAVARIFPLVSLPSPSCFLCFVVFASAVQVDVHRRRVAHVALTGCARAIGGGDGTRA